MVFCIEVVAITEQVWPTARITSYIEQDNDKALIMECDTVEEKWERELIKEMEYKRKMARYHDQHTKSKDLVLRNARIMGIDQKKIKLSPKWEGSYMVHKKVRPGTYRLSYEDGQVIDCTWHLDNLNKFYQYNGN